MSPTSPLDDMRTISQLLTAAERIARELGEEEPGAEHLLLAALTLPDGSALRALERVGLDADRIRAALREEHTDALVSAGIPSAAAKGLSAPTPLGRARGPLLYAAGPTAREAFRSAGSMARASKRQLIGAHVVVAVAGLERGTVPRVLERLGVERGRLAEAAEREIAAAG